MKDLITSSFIFFSMSISTNISGCVAKKPLCYNLIINFNEIGELPYEVTL